MAKEVELIVTAKDNASGTMKNVGDNSKKMADTMKKNLNAIRIASGLAFAGLVAVGKKFVDAGMEAIEAETKMTAVLKKRTNATDEQVQSILKLTQAQQKIGIIEDDLQVAGAGQLATFLKTTKSIETLIPAMNNLVAQQSGVNAGAGDMINTANLFGKVMSGNVGILARYGIILTDAQKKQFLLGNEQERAGMLAQFVADKVGNMNEVLAGTFQGRMQQLKNTLGNVGETIGMAMIPALEKLLEKIMPVITRVTEWIEKNPELTAKILMVSTAIAGLVFGITLLVPAITSIITLVQGLGLAFGLVGAVGMGPLGLVIIGITALVALLLIFRGSVGETTVTLGDMTKAMDDSNTATVEAQDALDAYNQYKLDNSGNIAELEKLRVKAVELQNQLIATLKAQQALAQKAMAQDQKTAQSGQSQGAGSTAGMGQYYLGQYGNATVGIQNAQNNISTLNKKALGGSVFTGKAYQVGEQGPEMFVPNTSGKIIPNDKQGGNITVNLGGVTVQNEADENRLVQKIANALKRQNELYSLGIN